MRRVFVTLAAIAIVFVCSGCSRLALDARQLSEPVSMTRNIGDETTAGKVTPFESKARVGYLGWLFNLVTLKEADLGAMVQKEVALAGGGAARNVTINKEMSFVDGLIYIVTLGFYAPETITVRGEVVSGSRTP